MTAILKTLPTCFARGRIDEFLRAVYSEFYFTLGRGLPQRAMSIRELYLTHQGRILGHFDVQDIVQNKGQLPLLTTLDGRPSEWQIKPDRWVAVCRSPFHWLLPPDVYHAGFRGWRYFDLEAYASTLESKVNL